VTPKLAQCLATIGAALMIGGPCGPAVSCAQDGARREEPKRRPTAEAVLDALRKSRPANQVVPPASSPSGVHARALLLPEGTSVLEQEGTIARQDAWWFFQPADLEQAALRLLPNATLEAMVRMVQHGSPSQRFVVSGELVVFRDHNYLLAREVIRGTPPQEQSTPPGTNEKRADPDEKALGHSVDSKGDATDVMAVLKRQGPIRERVAEVELSPTLADGDAGSFAPVLDGTVLIHRPGRVARRGDWWTFVFESDDPEHPEPPIRLLPARGTETMADENVHQTGGVVFSVSGEITAFFGNNYLLPRAVTRRFESGNLRK